MRYGVRTTVRVSDEWLSVCAICLHMGLNPKGHQLHTLCQICSLLMITKNQDTRWKILNAQGRNVPCVSCPHRLLLWCQTSEAPPCRFAFVSIINASGLVNGYKPFYYRRQRTYSQCRYISELNSKFCVDYSMRRRSITMNPDYVQSLQTSHHFPADLTYRLFPSELAYLIDDLYESTQLPLELILILYWQRSHSPVSHWLTLFILTPTCRNPAHFICWQS